MNLVDVGDVNMYAYQLELWDAINEYVESCNGDTSKISNRRMNAVVNVERVIDIIKNHKINNYRKKED
jgi:hypothetical protein